MSLHLPDLPPCPHLPPVEAPLRASSMRELGGDRGPRFYLRALQCAQSLWRQGLPAQALLLLDRAFGADLRGGEGELEAWPLPYAAMKWILAHRREGQFIGNPRRHFQHLATRMVEPRRELRAWRAWACWVFARQCHPHCPADTLQLEREGVAEPAEEEIFARLATLGLPGEAELWRTVASRPAGAGRNPAEL